MPVAVMAESAFSFKKLLDQCENQELEVTVRVALGRAAGFARPRAAPVSRATWPGRCEAGGVEPGARLLRRRLRTPAQFPELAGSFLLVFGPCARGSRPSRVLTPPVLLLSATHRSLRLWGEGAVVDSVKYVCRRHRPKEKQPLEI